jgi:hypothetical protein
MAALPVGIGAGILKCRLYDIDRIIALAAARSSSSAVAAIWSHSSSQA